MSEESQFKIITTYFISFVAFLSMFLFFKHVDISLWYHNNQPVYYHNQTFETVFQEPGNPAELIADYIGQFMQNNITGSLLLTLLLVLWVVAFGIITGTFASSTKSLSLIILSITPFLIAHGYYNFPLYLTISYVFTALTACLIVPIIKHFKLYITCILYSILSILTYFFWGNSGLWLFIGISAGLFLTQKKYANLFLIIIPLIIPMICLSIYSNLSLQEAYWGDFLLRIYNFAPWPIKAIPVLAFVIILILLLFQRIIHQTLRWYYSLSIHTVIIIVSLGLVYSFSYNDSQKKRILIDKLAYNGEWIELLKSARDIDLTKERVIQFQVNRALCHEGVLLDNMFIYPQYFGIDGLFLDKKTTGAIAMPTSDLYYDMSFCNGARHWANEASIIYGPQPRIIKRLISCYIISNQFDIASTYLSLLELSGKHKDWALRMKTYLNCETCVDNSTEFSSLLKNKNLPDEFEALNYPVSNVSLLCSEGKRNKMAIEYLVAYDMLKHDLKSIVDDLKLLKEIGYKKLPRSVQEALLIYILKEKDFDVDLLGFSIDVDVQKDFNSFNKIFASVQGDKSRAKSLHNPYKNTYWYYNVYKSPITNGRMPREN